MSDFAVPPNVEEIMEIRCASKRGQRVSPDDHDKCSSALRDFAEWYRVTEAEVFNRTVPFGSNVIMEPPASPADDGEGD